MRSVSRVGPDLTVRWWADRFRRRSTGSFADAYLAIGWLTFNLRRTPSESWSYVIGLRWCEIKVMW